MIRVLTRLRCDTRAVAMLEFAFGLPVLLLTGCFGVEIANYALANLRVSQVALALADNASRVGVSNLSTQQLREVDLVDVLQATRVQGTQLNITKYGRVVLSSLEADANSVQRIHWQRCIGLKSGTGYDSSYGTTLASAGTETGPLYAGTLSPGGMGDTGAKVTSPDSSGVMFVEVNYLYQPLFGAWLVGNRRIHYIASFIVRDRRDFAKVYNPDPAVASRMTCDKYTA